MIGRPDSRPTSFLTLEPHTPVVDRFGHPLGDVQRIMLHEDGGFDGLVVRTRAGTRFVDAPEVRRIAGGAVVLGITATDVEQPPLDSGRAHRVPQARHDRVDVTEADRDHAIDALKRSYVRDELTTDELGERVALAHLAETLEELGAALANLTVG